MIKPKRISIAPKQPKISWFNSGSRTNSIILWAIRGAHSKIPACCIQWFITSWIKIVGKEAEDYRNFLKTLEPYGYKSGCGYIPCPVCVKEKTFVEIHHCDKNDPECQKYSADLDMVTKQFYKFHDYKKQEENLIKDVENSAAKIRKPRVSNKKRS